MTTGNWINLVAAILVGGGTLTLAVMTWKSIRQTRGIHEREQKQRLLNEIIEWAIDVAGWNFKLYNFIEAQIAKQSWVESSIGEIVSQFQVVEAKGDYINTIALFSFKRKRKLLSAVKAVNKEIRELVDISMKRLDGKVATEAVTEHMNLLRSKITELLKETAKIKTGVRGNKEENMSKEGEPVRSNKIILKDIEKHLTRIEGYVIQIRKNMKAQGVGGLGFTSMAAGMALVATGVQTTGGLVIFGAGLILALYSFYFM